jgi:hypothetical protein
MTKSLALQDKDLFIPPKMFVEIDQSSSATEKTSWVKSVHKNKQMMHKGNAFSTESVSFVRYLFVLMYTFVLLVPLRVRNALSH